MIFEITAISGIVPLACGYEIQRSWTATDDCGNSTTLSQTITVLDTTDPVAQFSAPDVTIECDEDEPVVDPIFTDNCDDDLEITAISGIIPMECGYQIQRSWTATDDCGNSTTVSQTITVLDTTDPVAQFSAPDVTIECDEDEPAVDPIFTDNCDDDLEITAISGIVPLACGYEIQRSWTATDDCGNSTTVSQTITVLDTTDPVAQFSAPDVTIECDEDEPVVDPVFTDNCDDDLEITAISGIVPLACGYEIQRSWTATDDCGNSTTVSQTITVQDTTDPVAQFSAPDVTIECDEDEPEVDPVFTDNCDDDLELTAISGIIPMECGYQIQRSWTATDDCGNSTTVSQTITVLDTTDPVAQFAAPDVTIECDEDEPEVDPVFTDNCDDDLELTAISGIIPMECGYQIQRSWTATDDCGNSTTVSQTITVLDTTDPVAQFSAPDVTIECDEDEPVVDPIFTDNCDDDLEITAISGYRSIGMRL